MIASLVLCVNIIECYFKGKMEYILNTKISLIILQRNFIQECHKRRQFV